MFYTCSGYADRIVRDVLNNHVSGDRDDDNGCPRDAMRAPMESVRWQIFEMKKSGPPNRRKGRSWSRFSFRTFLIVISCLCVALSFYFPRAHASARFRISTFSPESLSDCLAAQEAVIKGELIILVTLRNRKVFDLPLIQRQSDPDEWLRRNLVTSAEGDVLEVRLAGRSSEKPQLDVIVDALATVYVEQIATAMYQSQQMMQPFPQKVTRIIED